MTEPTLTIIAGANGSGKTTLTRWAKAYFQKTAILDPDAVVVDLQAQTNAPVGPIEAGRQLLTIARQYLASGVSFSVETTLSGRTYLSMLATAKSLGYRTCLIYIGTEDVTINIKRVKARVLAGGHDVPVADQLRRFPRSYHNLKKALEIADEAVLIDNSSDEGHRVIALKVGHQNMRILEPLPNWAMFLHA